MTGKRSLRMEIMLLCTLAISLAAILTGAVAYQLLREQQLQQTMQTMHNLADARAESIERHIDVQINHLSEISRASEIILAMAEMQREFARDHESVAYYDADNRYRSAIQTILEQWKYYDIFLINLQGDIVFSLTHEVDFATNLEHGPYRDTGLAQVWRESLNRLSPAIAGFEYYEPSKKPGAFLAAPILDGERLAGVLAFQLNTEIFYQVTENLSGLGDTGEIILGANHREEVLITAPTRHNPDAAFKLSIPRSNELALPIKQATHGETGHGVLKDLRGIEVVAAWDYLPSLQWGLVTKIDVDEALYDLNAVRNKLLLAIGAILWATLLTAGWISGRISRPLTRLTRATSTLAQQKRVDADDAVGSSSIYEVNQLWNAFLGMAEEIRSHHESQEQKIKERTVELSRLQAAIEQAHDIVMITDRDAVIQYVNPAFESTSGFSAAEAVGRRANLVKSGRMSPEFYRQMWDTILAGRIWHADFINRDKAGQLYEVEQSISPIMDDNHNITGFVSVQRDVTEERKQQQQLEHTQRLESLGVLAGGIAHDFNNLLTAILGNAGLARRRTPDDSPVAANLEHIEDASERAADLCKQMLAYSGKGKFVVVPINLSTLIWDITDLLKVSISKNVTLRTDLEEDLPNIEADKAQMQQVIMNLVINASEAIGDDHGNIVLHTGWLDADADYLSSTEIDEPLTAGRYVFMEISDDGCGMDSETLTRLYDPFFTTKFTGRGLGMSAILGIVRGHHGAIKVYSEPGKGTTFKVLLPSVDLQIDQSVKEKAIQDNWNGSGRILVVDDELHIRQTSILMLEELGFEVMTATNGQEGVEIFEREHPYLKAVLLDMTMPVMDGKTAFGKMHQINPDVKIILTSGYNEQDATSQFAGKGLAGFIQKPYRLQHLRNKLREFLAE